MLYILALILPPLAVMGAGRIISGLIMAVFWFFSVLLTYGMSHIVFVILAWVMIAQTRGDQRHRELLRAMSKT